MSIPVLWHYFAAVSGSSTGDMKANKEYKGGLDKSNSSVAVLLWYKKHEGNYFFVSRIIWTLLTLHILQHKNEFRYSN